MSHHCWADEPFAAFDIESTGLDVETARIVTATILTIEGSVVKERGWLADPGIEIPEPATAVHGITTAHARAHGQPAARVVEEIHGVLEDLWVNGVPVVIYNAPYDITVLDRELRRHLGHGIGTPGPIVDPLTIDRAQDKYRKGSHKLADVCRHHGIVLSEDDAHTSAGDCLAAARLAWKLAHHAEYGHMACIDIDLLQRHQEQWYATWAKGYERHRRQQLVRDGASDSDLHAAVVPRDWPLRPYREEAMA